MISVFGSMVDEEEINNVKNCMKSQWLGFGKTVSEFESKFEKKFSLQNFLMVDSGSNALYMALVTMNLPKGSEVILPSFTWVSCAQAIILAGCRPVFCDVDYDSMNITSECIKPHITKDTSAIMVVHYAGLPVDMDPILALGFPVLEDAAHAVCSKYKGKPCGQISDYGIFSFDAVKNFTVGEGGGFVTKSKDAYERAKQLRYCGIGKSGFDSASDSTKDIWWEYNITEPFIKMLPTNLNAAIGLGQINSIDRHQRRREEIWEIYNKAFSKNKNIKTPLNALDDSSHSYFTYSIRVPKRNNLAKYLLENEIYTTLRYHPLHLNNLYSQTSKNLSNTNLLNETALSIPLHPRLTEKEVEYVISKILNFFDD